MLTCAIELLVAGIFLLWQKKLIATILITNIGTQLLLNISLMVEELNEGGGWGYVILYNIVPKTKNTATDNTYRYHFLSIIKYAAIPSLATLNPAISHTIPAINNSVLFFTLNMFSSRFFFMFFNVYII